MESKRVDIHEGARKDLAGALEWYLDRSEIAAAEFVEEIRESLERIAAAPLLYPRHKYGTIYRKLRRFPFLIIYWVAHDSISVVAVQHERRESRHWRERLDDVVPP